MYELIQVSELCYYIQCPAKIGVVRTDENNVVLIDSGNDKNAGKKALKILEQRNWRLQAVFNTHSHADPIGGNRFLQERAGCKIYAPGIERDFTCHPILEPVFIDILRRSAVRFAAMFRHFLRSFLATKWTPSAFEYSF